MLVDITIFGHYCSAARAFREGGEILVQCCVQWIALCSGVNNKFVEQSVVGFCVSDTVVIYMNVKALPFSKRELFAFLSTWPRCVLFQQLEADFAKVKEELRTNLTTLALRNLQEVLNKAFLQSASNEEVFLC